LNYSALYSRSRLITVIGELVNVLALSEWTFQRDYDKLVAQIDEARSGLDGSYYPEFLRRLRAKADKVVKPHKLP